VDNVGWKEEFDADFRDVAITVNTPDIEIVR
jgi:hypothetical protein